MKSMHHNFNKHTDNNIFLREITYNMEMIAMFVNYNKHDLKCHQIDFMLLAVMYNFINNTIIVCQIRNRNYRVIISHTTGICIWLSLTTLMGDDWFTLVSMVTDSADALDEAADWLDLSVVESVNCQLGNTGLEAGGCGNCLLENKFKIN